MVVKLASLPVSVCGAYVGTCERWTGKTCFKLKATYFYLDEHLRNADADGGTEE